MARLFNYVTHINETLKIYYTHAYANGSPKSIANLHPFFAISEDYTNPAIITYNSNNNISVYNANASVYEIKVQPFANTVNAGYHMYQLKLFDASANTTEVVLEGTLDIRSSLFDNS